MSTHAHVHVTSGELGATAMAAIIALAWRAPGARKLVFLFLFEFVKRISIII
jgi:hypothetical protein